jgi:hypothetical protein
VRLRDSGRVDGIPEIHPAEYEQGRLDRLVAAELAVGMHLNLCPPPAPPSSWTEEAMARATIGRRGNRVLATNIKTRRATLYPDTHAAAKALGSTRLFVRSAIQRGISCHGHVVQYRPRQVRATGGGITRVYPSLDAALRATGCAEHGVLESIRVGRRLGGGLAFDWVEVPEEGVRVA